LNETRPARIVATRAAEAVESPDLLAADRALIEPPKRGSNTFWIGLALAVMLHLAPFLASALGVVRWYRCGEWESSTAIPKASASRSSMKLRWRA
jgi:hypothetical protein